MGGKWDVFERADRRNIRTLQERGVMTLYVTYPGCWVTLAHHCRDWADKMGLEWDMEVKPISQLAAELVSNGKLRFKRPVNMKVTWHYPCRIGRHGGIYEEPREALRAIPGLELVVMEHNREEGLCCGSVLALIGETRPTSGRIAPRRLAEARATCVQAVATTCQWRVPTAVGNAAEGSGLRVLDFAAVVAEDPDP